MNDRVASFFRALAALATMLLAAPVLAVCVNPNPNPNPAQKVLKDFNHDCKSDVLWTNAISGQSVMWLMNGTSISTSSSPASVSDPNWHVVGMGDFDNDGKADLLWQNRSTGQVVIWLMNGTTIQSTSSPNTVADLHWQVVGVGDVDGDGKADIVWQNRNTDTPGTGMLVVWLMNGVGIKSTGSPNSVSDQNWVVQGIGDFDGDGNSDLLWQNRSTGAVVTWLMNGITIKTPASPTTVADLHWQVVAVGDFDGDGKADVLWQNRDTGSAGTGVVVLWKMNGATIASSNSPNTVSDQRWQVQGAGDFNGDGKADVLWKNTTSGTTVVWLMNGAVIIVSGAPNTVTDSRWGIVGAPGPLFLESVVQQVSAAAGGTITLPRSGSNVVIPPAALAANQAVRLDRISSVSSQPPGGTVVGVGSTLSLTFANDQPFLGTAQIHGLQFTLNHGASLPAGATGSIPIANIIDDDNYAALVSLPSCSSTSTCTVVPVGTLQSLPVIRKINVNAANLRPAVEMAPLPNPGGKSWNGTNWVDGVGPLDPTKKYLILVHGMASQVEQAFPDVATVEGIRQAGGYDYVLGFDYDWTQGLSTSGTQLSNFLTSLKSAGLQQADLEAHSEGGPVTLSALCQNSDLIIGNLAMLGSPVMGTPAATLASTVQQTGQAIDSTINPLGTVILNLQSKFGLPQGNLQAVMNGQFAPDMQPGSQVLSNIRSCVAQKMQSANSTLSGTNTRCVGANNYNNPDPTNNPGALRSLGDLLKPFFNGSSYDAIVGTDSANCVGSGFSRVTSQTYALSHTQLESNPQVIADTGTFVKSSRRYTLAISTVGSGSGTVSANPPGPTYSAGTAVVLTATAHSGSVFAGWYGSCPGSCVMNGNMDAVATFNLQPVGPQPVVYVGTASGSSTLSSPWPAECAPNPSITTGSVAPYTVQMTLAPDFFVPGPVSADTVVGPSTITTVTPTEVCTYPPPVGSITTPGQTTTTPFAGGGAVLTGTSNGATVVFDFPPVAGCTGTMTGTLSGPAPVTGLVQLTIHESVTCIAGNSTGISNITYSLTRQ